MYDVWFISYNEPNAEENWYRVKKMVPRARRISGVKGLVNAYKTAADCSKTKWFWIIDGDNWLLKSSVFNFVCPDSTDSGHLFVWPAKNSVNGLKYGNGAVKLYNRNSALSVPDNAEDFSIAVCKKRIKLPVIASETRINSSPYQAWAAGFREGFKLHKRIKNGEGNAEKQYKVWTISREKIVNGKYATEGAKLGYAMFAVNPNFLINDRSALSDIFINWAKVWKNSEG